MKLDFFVKLKYQSITKILSVGIKHSARHLLCHVNNYARLSICVIYGKWCQRSLWHQRTL